MTPKTIIIRGRLTGPRQVELEQAVSQATPPEVEVVIHPAKANGSTQTISDWLRCLPPGTRSKAEIDQQLQAERDGWGDR